MPTLDLIARFIGVDAGAGREFESISAKAEESSFAWAKYAAGAAVAAGTVGAVSIEMADKFEEAHTRLESAIKNVGGNMEELGGSVSSLDSRMQDLGFTNTDVQSGLAGLVTATKDPAKAIHDMALAADLARGRNMDLATATTTLVKVETGHVSLLGRLGINTKNAAGETITQEQALQRLTDLYGGDASRYADTYGGKVARLKAEAEDLGIKIGLVLVPALVDVVGIFEGGAHAVEDVAKFFKDNEVAAAALAAVLGGTLLPYMARIVTFNLAAVFLSAKGAMAGLTGESVGLKAGLGSLLGAINPVTAAFSAAAIVGYEFWHQSKQAAEAGKKAADDYAQSLDNTHTSLAAQTATVGDLTKHVVALTNNLGSGNIDKNGAQLGETAKNAIAAGQALVTMRSNVHDLAYSFGISTRRVQAFAKANGIDLAGNLNDAAAALENAMTPTQKLSHDNQVLKRSVSGSANAVDALTQKLDILIGGPLAEHEAALTFAQDLRKLGDAAKGNTGKINDTTKAGQANAKSLQTLAGDIQTSVSNWEKQGLKVDQIRPKLLAMEKNLRSTADATTGNKAAVDKYLSSLNLTPGQINKVLGSLKSLGKGMDDQKNKAGADGQATGTDYGQGLVAGLRAMRSAVAADAAALANVVDPTVRRVMDARSPSRKARKTGQDYGTGLSQGISDSKKPVQLSVGRVAHLIDEGMRGGWHGLASSIRSALGGGLQNELSSFTDHLTHDLDRQVAALGKAEDKYKSLEKARRSAITSLSSSIAGNSDISNVLGLSKTVTSTSTSGLDYNGATATGGDTTTTSRDVAYTGNVAKFLKGQLGPLRAEARGIAKLRKMGLSQALISQIASQSPADAVTLINQITSGQDGSIASLNQMESRIRTLAKQTATTVVESPHEKRQLHVAERQVALQHQMVHEQRRTNRHLERIAAHAIAGSLTVNVNGSTAKVSDAQGKEIIKTLRRLARQGVNV